MFKLILIFATIILTTAQPIGLNPLTGGGFIGSNLRLADLTRAALGRPTLALEDLTPEPYTFAFRSNDEFGTTLIREETSDGSGAVKGSYGYTDALGLSRLVEYVADAAGFRAVVRTNEPGTANANPADVIMQSTAQ